MATEIMSSRRVFFLSYFFRLSFFFMSFFFFISLFLYFFLYFFHCVYFMWCGAVICYIWFPILMMTVTSILEARHQEKRNSNNHNHVIVRFIIYCHCYSGVWNASVSPEQRTTVAHTFTDLTTWRAPLSQHPPILAPTIHPTVLPRHHLYVTPHLFSAIISVASSTETLKIERTPLNSPAMVPANGVVYKSNNTSSKGQAHKGCEQRIHITTSYTNIHEDTHITHDDWTWWRT